MVKIDVLGAGIVGLWQAFMLRRRGHDVALWDRAGIPGGVRASQLAGAMLAPYCEGEPGHELALKLGLEALPLWREHYPELSATGTLVVAAARDRADYERFASQTHGHRRVAAVELSTLEPALSGRFHEGLYFPDEAHVEPGAAMAYLARELRRMGVVCEPRAYPEEGGKSGGLVIDCRGLGARDDLKTLRGVRGERILIEAKDVRLTRPIRLLHPRIPFYIVPWPAGQFMIGATLIESADGGPATLRSAMELLSCAYALLPELGEARIVEIAAGVRPSFPDNAPKIVVGDKRIFVNGLYRHGFLVSPILAEITANYIETGEEAEGVLFEDHGEW
jgi:glycine oxidase